MKKLMTLGLMMIALISMAACTSDDTEDYTYLSVDINPAMEMIINQEQKVVSYTLKNEAAEIVAAGLNLESMNYEEALHLYLNAAVQTGYIDIDRNDNAVAIQAYQGEDETGSQFQLEVQNKLQTYFQENALGAVILYQGEVSESLQALVDDYDISLGYAKLIEAYLGADESNTLEDALALTPKEIIDTLVIEHEASMLSYRNQRQVEAQNVKDEMEEALRSRVEAHQALVDGGSAVQPDTTGVKAAYLNNYEGLKAEFTIRNQERVEYAYACMNGEVAEYLVGTYEYLSSSDILEYTVTHYTFTLNDDDTYEESFEITYSDERGTVILDETGFWEVVSGELVLTSDSEATKTLTIQGSKICFENEDLIILTFKKIASQNS
ncbi:MAG: hypothetical protein JXC31_00080 [Acholeplasmataceae bacterium]|nr:hypothetical protein [Acholeplasmataceae bacterium]